MASTVVLVEPCTVQVDNIYYVWRGKAAKSNIDGQSCIIGDYGALLSSCMKDQGTSGQFIKDEELYCVQEWKARVFD